MTEESKYSNKQKGMILVTGGLGFIGSHTVVLLLKNGFDCVVIDNMSNCSEECRNRIEKLADKKFHFYNTDLRSKEQLIETFSQFNIKSVIHFAGCKSVSESVRDPLKYYENNIAGTINLLQVMKQFDVKNLVFSSSATVYGNPKELPISETHQTGDCFNPYGRSKYFIEEILKDVSKTGGWKISILRYFNPIGAHPSGQIGEHPNDIPNNLLPYISQVAVGKRSHLSVFGNDYDTIDGTGVRDYIHVMDLSMGHIKAVEHMENSTESTYFEIFNLGTGNGLSVLQVVKSFEVASNQKIPIIITDRRDGDVASCYADPTRAYDILGWKAALTLNDMSRDAWNWQKSNPNGYDA